MLASSALDAPAWKHAAARERWIPASGATLAFRFEDEAGNVNTHPEGMIERRRRSVPNRETRRLHCSDGVELVRLDGMEGYGVDCFRVRPGEMGIAGFLLNRDSQAEGPFARFLRFYQTPPRKDAWLGAFGVEQGPGQLVSVTMEEKPEIVEKLRQVRQRLALGK